MYKRLLPKSAGVFFSGILCSLLCDGLCDAQAQERIALRGTEIRTEGRMPRTGEPAPKFTATGRDLREVKLSEFRGRNVILNIFPSLDTPTCAMSVREFNTAAAALDNTVVLCLSMDLPFAQGRFCAAEGLDDVVPLSLFRSQDFFSQYGLRITEGEMRGLAARAVLVLDAQGVVRHAQLVPEITREPDYETALRIAKEL